MTDRPALLIMQRHLAPLTAFLEGDYIVYRFWEGPPLEAQAEILSDYDELEPDDIRAALAYAANALDHSIVTVAAA